MTQLGVTQRMVEEPDLASDAENELRSQLLTAYRGWRINQYLFRGWLARLAWSRAVLDPADPQRIWYANAPEWTELSRGTWRAADGAKRIAERDPSLTGWCPQTLDAINGVTACCDRALLWSRSRRVDARERGFKLAPGHNVGDGRSDLLVTSAGKLQDLARWSPPRTQPGGPPLAASARRASSTRTRCKS